MTDARVAGERQFVQISRMRGAVGRRMAESKRQAPHFYVSVDVVLDDLLSALAVVNDKLKDGERVTVTAALISALANVLGSEPMFNARWVGDQLELSDEINVGVAVPVADGLLAPAVLQADRLGLVDLARALADLVERARVGRLKSRELSEATFTLSNLGMHGVSAFSAIIVPPQVAILAVGSASPRPWVADGQVVVRRVMTATLSADHRVVDGVEGARFLGRLRDRLESADDWIGG